MRRALTRLRLYPTTHPRSGTLRIVVAMRVPLARPHKRAPRCDPSLRMWQPDDPACHITPATVAPPVPRPSAICACPRVFMYAAQTVHRCRP